MSGSRPPPGEINANHQSTRPKGLFFIEKKENKNDCLHC